MYTKNLTEDLRLRLSKRDMDFLRMLSESRCVTVSEVIRSIIGEYRRSVQTMDVLQQALKMAQIQDEVGGCAVHGDTKTNFNDLV